MPIGRERSSSDRSSPIVQQVIGSVLAAGVLAVVGWLLSLLVPLAEWVREGSLVIPGFVIAVLAFLAAGTVGWTWQKWRRQAGVGIPPEVSHKPPFEIAPFTVVLDLMDEVPRVEITLRAINYDDETLGLREVIIRRLSLGTESPVLEAIPLRHDIDVPGRSSRIIYCGRALVDSEARAVTRRADQKVVGAVSLTARAVVKGTATQIQSSDQVVHGWLRSRPG